MGQYVDCVPSVRVRKSIKDEQNLYICVDQERCFVKFSFENRPENAELRDIITSICDAVTEGLQRLNTRAKQA